MLSNAYANFSQLVKTLHSIVELFSCQQQTTWLKATAQICVPILTQNTWTSGISVHVGIDNRKYEGWNFNSGNYLFTTDTK